MKKYLIIFLLSFVSVFGQPNHKRPEFFQKHPFESEIISIPGNDSTYSVYFTYRMPYRFLVFEREDDSFGAEFRVTVEILDENENLVKRDIKDRNISVNDFNETKDHSLFLQDFLLFKLKPAKYKVSTTISDLNSSSEMPSKPIELDLHKEENKIIYHPIVIESAQLLCDSSKSFLLANAGGNIPYSPVIFNLVIPVSDTSIENLNVQIINNDEEIYSGKITESYLIPFGLTLCEQNLAVTVDSSNSLLKNFVLRDVNQKLSEGKAILKISDDEKGIDEEYKSRIVWFSKPFSLMDPEKAIEYLSYIESDSVISIMLDEDESDYPKILNEYWKKFDPTPETSYNEIMVEYYNRIDYANKEFRSIGSGNGAKTDRGMIYIKFGKPEKIERISNPQGQIVEVWTYVNPERKFSFIDKKGTGNFTLIEE